MPYADSNYERNWQRQAKGWVLHPVKHEGHTPGPWDYDDDSKEVFSSCTEHRCGWIAYLDGNDSNDCSLPEGMRIANARLIAAAPDLLEACEELLIYLGDWDDTENETCVAARRAIAKARGQEVPNG